MSEAAQESSPIHTEGAAPGVALDNYRRVVASDDGTYVTVTNHTERIEYVPQPPTPEEVAQQKKSERLAMMISGGIGALFLGVIGWVIYQDEKSSRRVEIIEETPPA